MTNSQQNIQQAMQNSKICFVALVFIVISAEIKNREQTSGSSAKAEKTAIS